MWQTCFRLQKYDFIKLRSETIYKILLGKFRKSYLKISNCISSFRLRCNFIILLLGHYNISELSLYFHSLYLAEQTLVLRIKYISFFLLQRSRILKKRLLMSWIPTFDKMWRKKFTPPYIALSPYYLQTSSERFIGQSTLTSFIGARS